VEPELQIKADSCICRLCNTDAKKVGDPNFTPRWRKRKGTALVSCYVPHCTKSDIKVTKKGNMQDLLKFFEIEHPNDANLEQVPLCTHHYMQWYRQHQQVSSHIICTTCGKYIDDFSKSRPVSEANKLQQFLVTNTTFRGEINSTDRVCLSCYKAHLIVFKHIKSSVSSTDSDLQDTIEGIRKSLPKPTDLKSWADVLDFSCYCHECR